MVLCICTFSTVELDSWGLLARSLSVLLVRDLISKTKYGCNPKIDLCPSPLMYTPNNKNLYSILGKNITLKWKIMPKIHKRECVDGCYEKNIHLVLSPL